MRSIAFILAIAALAGTADAQRYTRGYVTRNGTYVAPHYSSTPNSTRLDNWSTRGNVNPYTGQVGTRNPYPSLNSYSSSRSTYGSYSNPYGSHSGDDDDPQ